MCDIISRYHAFAKRLPTLEVVGLLRVRDPSFALDSIAVASGDSSVRFFNDTFVADKRSFVASSLMIPGSSKAVTKEFPFLTEIIVIKRLTAIEEFFIFATRHQISQD